MIALMFTWSKCHYIIRKNNDTINSLSFNIDNFNKKSLMVVFEFEDKRLWKNTSENVYHIQQCTTLCPCLIHLLCFFSTWVIVESKVHIYWNFLIKNSFFFISAFSESGNKYNFTIVLFENKSVLAWTELSK